MSAANRRWTAAEVADQHGRTAVVTGASGGVGLETARVLAAKGATVVLACRDPAKGERAAEDIRSGAPGAEVTVQHLDLASLASVRAAAEALSANLPRIDLLVNNAGVMSARHRTTEDGFELQIGTNHLGHFALTGLLLVRLEAAPAARVVTVASNAHRGGAVDAGDLNFQRRRYTVSAAYSQSKLANLMFSYELARRLAAAGARTVATAAHPGGARTGIAQGGPLMIRLALHPALRRLASLMVQEPDMAALPVLRAAVDPEAANGDYYGPDGWGEWTGFPVRTTSRPQARDETVQARLWTESERLTGVTYPFPARSPLTG